MSSQVAENCAVHIEEHVRKFVIPVALLLLLLKEGESRSALHALRLFDPYWRGRRGLSLMYWSISRPLVNSAGVPTRRTRRDTHHFPCFCVARLFGGLPRLAVSELVNTFKCIHGTSACVSSPCFPVGLRSCSLSFYLSRIFTTACLSEGKGFRSHA